MAGRFRPFESFVNSERCKTEKVGQIEYIKFESFVNSERCKTRQKSDKRERLFESFVNSERCKTTHISQLIIFRLRALLIQKDVKRTLEAIAGMLV